MADYPISNVPRRIVYTGSAGVGPYAFNFEVLENTDITVYKNDVELTLTSDYTVSISPTLGTGTVTLVSAATGSDRITIVGARAVERTSDFTTGGDFFANTLNDELDSQVILIQQIAETAERGIKAPVTDPTTIDMTLPTNTERANKTLVFDANGNPTIGQLLGKYRGDWATGTNYIAYDFVIDPADYNVYICNAPHTSTGSAPIETNADASKWDLIIDAGAAGDAQIAAEAAQAAAELAETNAETAATNAATSASQASTSATNAATSATNAANSATSASTSATNASNSASSASTSATNAASSATSASSSATSASNSASTASTSATNAATSATNAANSASAAATSATNASNSASAASTSATNAANSASDAATSATNAANSYDAFDDRYLGAKSTAPTFDNDGNALLTGALYWNTNNNSLYVWDGSTWDQAAFDVSGTGVSSFNTRTGGVTLTSTDVTDALGYTPLQSSDITNVLETSDIGVSVQAYSANLSEYAAVNPTTAGLALLDDVDAAAQRTTLGLGTAATTASTDYATAAQGTKADTAVQPADIANVLETSDIGVSVQAYDADLTTWAGKTAPSGTVVGTSDSQTLTNKTLTDPAIIGTITEDVYTITDGAAFEINPGNGSIQLITLGASRTPKATNFSAGEAVTLMIDDGTAYTITWTDATFGGSGVVWKTDGGTAPTLLSTGYTIIVLWKVGTQVYGARVGDA